ncbi:conserved Plasmodium protein, unknown function [Plasmodium berghei]|uniref:Uncharacterized protein n=2 Tax=Plasmodium berghei TaxID=5821 RepID=A0A509AJE1_PLABA|nr:conserved Plasmodium protein, unknown function [Plasmodium berghei ANKA]CXI40535.1 conserved Plasmodium protein, unknown function [Plasmodium berghei]SCN25069.1 conserved Plasmodium protein, unknown function [Plasmodium berghei]SCO60092.1 conserved Plasmodium protein, unknown function [Plasmodium berghei]VUC55616.1 conserved Plasmodium protein, unknown function [Plasmodium berghei ANKA]|eukprot:XP_034421426.1 conserved Plasmodium protein, unknown function [Plasmodium berghei ANKA]
MEEYTKKIPIFNDYETKKDLLKFMCLKENDDDNNNNNLKKNNDDVKFIIKKRETMNDILNHRPDLNTRTQKDILFERKAILKENNLENYYEYEKQFPFFVNKIVTKPEVTKNIRAVLNNPYELDETTKIRISDDIKTKTTLLERRKNIFIKELGGNNMKNDEEYIQKTWFLDPEKNYLDAVKNKNKFLTLKNYGFGQESSDYIFSYPDIKAKGRGGYASEIVKLNIKQKANEKKKKWAVENIRDFLTNKNPEIREPKGVFLMQNRLKYINMTRDNHKLDNYLKTKPKIVLRYKGFQKQI